MNSLRAALLLPLACLAACAAPLSAQTPPADPAFTEQEKAVQRAAGEQFRAALLAAAARGDRRFVLPPGEYRLSAARGSTYAIPLEQAAGLVISAKGARLWLERGCGAFLFTACGGVTLEGIALDCDPLPFLQGRIAAMDAASSSLLLETEPGFGCERLAGPDGKAPRFAVGTAFDPATRRLKADCRELSVRGCAAEGPGKARIQVGLPAGETFASCNVAVGDLFAARGTGPGLVCSVDCRDLTFDGVDVRSSPGMGFYEQRNWTPTRYLRCRVARPEGSARLCSSDADAFHSSMSFRGPVCEDCLVEAAGDDAYTAHGFLDFVMGQAAPDRVTIAPLLQRDFDTGSTLTFYRFPSFERIGSAKVAGWESTQDAALLQDARQMNAEANRLGGRVLRMASREVLQVRLDAPLDLPRATVVTSDAYQSEGARYVRDVARNVRGRGFLLSGAGHLVEGNTVEWTTGPAVELSADVPWMQGPFSRDVAVRGNAFTDTFLSRGSRADFKTALGAVSVHIYTPRLVAGTPQERIAIEDNAIDGCYAPGIAVQNAAAVTIRGNRLRRTNLGDPLDLGKNLGLDPRFAILLAVVKDPVVAGNDVGPLPPGVREAGTDVHR